MYIDTTYIAKFYLNEPESDRVRALVRTADAVFSSMWAYAEFHSVLHRHCREDSLTVGNARELARMFSDHIALGLWKLVPINEALLRRTGTLMIAAPDGLFIRTADAVHLTTAVEIGESEVWTNDRHMLAAAAYFGIGGRSV